MKTSSGDLDGKRFGKLRVIREAEKKPLASGYSERQVLCQCDCGKIKVISKSKVKIGHTKSCGCLMQEKKTKHGMSRTKINAIWRNLKQRCNNTKDKSYKNYGGRGIRCEWKDFEEFYKDMGESYKISIEKYGQVNTTIDRVDNDGNYSKQNCRWSTRLEQQTNTRWNVNVELDGVTKTLSQWIRVSKINRHTINTRIYRDKMSPKEALTKELTTYK